METILQFLQEKLIYCDFHRKNPEISLNDLLVSRCKYFYLILTRKLLLNPPK